MTILTIRSERVTCRVFCTSTSRPVGSSTTDSAFLLNSDTVSFALVALGMVMTTSTLIEPELKPSERMQFGSRQLSLSMSLSARLRRCVSPNEAKSPAMFIPNSRTAARTSSIA